MSVTLMTTSTPRVVDEENRFPTHYSEVDQMARFSSTGGCRYNNGKDMVALLAMYIMILHILHPDRRRLRLHHLGAVSMPATRSHLHPITSKGEKLLKTLQAQPRLFHRTTTRDVAIPE